MMFARGILLVLGLSILGYVFDFYIEARDYSKWVSTKAQLESLEIYNASSPTVVGASDSGSDYGRVKYRYLVNNKEYIGIRIMPLQHVYIPREKLIDLKLGEIEIFYNPSKPSESYIYAISPMVQMYALIFCAFVICVLALKMPALLTFLEKAILKSA